jgi:hypothetical protein
MNPRNQSHRKPAWPRLAAVLGLQFAGWWCLFYLAVMLVALAEEAWLRHRGHGALARDAFDHVNIGQFQAAADGRWGTAVMGFRDSPLKSGMDSDVVLFECEQRIVFRLGLARFVPRCIAISPQGESVAIATDRAIYTIPRAALRAELRESVDLNMRLVQCIDDEGIGHLVFSPDGQKLAVTGLRYTHLLTYPAGDTVHRLPRANVAVSPVFSEDSRHLIVSGEEHQIIRYDVQEGRRLACWWPPKRHLVRTVLSAGGKLAAGACAGGDLSVWDVELGEELWRQPGVVAPQYSQGGIGFSQDGRLLTLACTVGERYQVHLFDAVMGTRVAYAPRCHGVFKGLVVTCDMVAYCWDLHGMIRGWDLAEGTELWCFAWPRAAQGDLWPLVQPDPSPQISSPSAPWFFLRGITGPL